MAPPVRRPAATPPPWCTTIKGWLSRCRRPTRNRGKTGGGGGVVDSLSIMPDDLLFDSIFSRVFSDAADVARCAAVCSRWGRIVTAREPAIRRALPPPPARRFPHLALGFFHGGGGIHTRRQVQFASPCFVPTAYGSVLLGSPPPLPGLLDQEGGLFHCARQVASRNGLVAVELWQPGPRGDGGIALGVCNPMTGDVAIVPPLAGDDFPAGRERDFACAILTADDLNDAAPPHSPGSPFFFSLVLLYNRGGFTAVRCYTSDAGSWGPEARKPGAKLGAHVVRCLGPAAVLRGVAYWPMDRAALGVRGPSATDAMDDVFFEVPYELPHLLPDYRLLGTTADGRLSYVSAGLSGHKLIFEEDVVDLQGVDDGLTMTTAAGAVKWERRQFIRLKRFKVSKSVELRLRWIGDRSGTVLFTIGRGGGSNGGGAFTFNLATRSVEKLADGVECNSWRNLCGYEMDRDALLACITARYHGSTTVTEMDG